MNKSKWLRRGLALVLIMVVVALPLLSLGGEGSKDQIGQYVDVDANGDIIANTGSLEYTKQIVDKNNKDITIDFSKKIDATDEENIFQITLGVDTNEIREEITEPSNVLLVFDVSTSMDHSLNSNAFITDPNIITRWMVYKESMKNFINDFIGEGGDYYHEGNKLAIIAFGGSNTGTGIDYETNKSVAEIHGWTDNAGKAVASFYDYKYVAKRTVNDINAKLKKDGKTERVTGETLRGKYFNDRARDFANTNIEAGLQEAGDYLVTAKNNGLKPENTSVILVTDGEATRSNSNPTNSDAGTTHSDAVKYSIAEAKNLRENHKEVKLFGFSIGDKAANGKLMKDDVMNKDAKVFNTNSEKEMAAAFTALADRITHKAKVWNVKDPMSKWVNFKDWVGEKSKYADIDENSEILWKLSDDNFAKDGDIYSYSISYLVELNTEAEGYNEGVYYPTNKETSLEYTFISTMNDDDEITEEDANKEKDLFRIPTVKGPGEVVSEATAGDIKPSSATEQQDGSVQGETAVEEQGSVKGEEGFAEDESSVLGEEAKTSDSMKIILPLIIIALIAVAGLVIISVRQRKQG